MSHRRTVVVVAVVSLAAIAFRARAEQTNQLPEVVVTSTRLPGEQITLAKFPANVTVLDRDQIAASPAVSLPDLLRQQTGLAPIDTVGMGQFGNVVARGFGERTGLLILIDGVRVNDAGDSTLPYLWNTIPLDNIDRVEIIRGGASTTFGEGAIAGVINIITRKPDGKLFNATATGASGNLGYYAGHIELTGRTNTFEYVASVDRQEWDGWREGSAYRGWTAIAKPAIDTAAGKFTLGYYFHDETVENPGPLTLAQLQSNPRQSGANLFVFDNTIHRGTLDYFKALDSGWTVIGKLFGQDFTTDSFSPFGTGTIEQPNYGTTWQASYCADLCGRPNMVTLGVEGIQQDFQSGFSSSFGQFDTGADNWTVSVFAQDTFEVTDRLALIGGLRYDYREWNVTATSPFAAPLDVNRHADSWSPKLGATFDIVEKTTSWITLSRSFRLPSGFDIGAAGSGGNQLFFANPGVDPVEANTIEVGVRCERSQYLHGSAAYYYSDVTDDILFDPFTFQNQNFDSTRQGVELTLNSDPVEWLALYATTAFTDARFDGGVYDDKHLPLVPEWQFTGGVAVKPVKGLSVGLEAVHARGQVASNDLNNNFADNEYTIVNAKASYTWKQFTAFVAVNNIFDKLYETFPAAQTDFFGNQTRQFNPAAGINFQAGATVRF